MKPIEKILDELKQLDKKATPGPWCQGRHDSLKIDNPEADILIFVGESKKALGRNYATVETKILFQGYGEGLGEVEQNTCFVAQSRTMMPRLVESIEFLLGYCDETGFGVTKEVEKILNGEE